MSSSELRYQLGVELLARGHVTIATFKELLDLSSKTGPWLSEYVAEIEDNGFLARLFPSRIDVLVVLLGCHELERNGVTTSAARLLDRRTSKADATRLVNEMLADLSLGFSDVWPEHTRLTYLAQVSTTVLRAEGRSPWFASVFDMEGAPVTPIEKRVEELARDVGGVRMILRKSETREVMARLVAELHQILRVDFADSCPP